MCFDWKFVSASGDQSMRTIAIAVACAVGYILFMLALTIYCRRKRLASRNRQLNKNGGLNGDEKGGAGVPDGANEPLVNANGRLSPTRELMPLQRRNLNVEKLQFPRQELQTTSLLGRGEYGDVFLAVAQGLHLNDSSVPRSTAGSASSSPTPSGEQLVMVKSLLQKEKNLQVGRLPWLLDAFIADFWLQSAFHFVCELSWWIFKWLSVIFILLQRSNPMLNMESDCIT